MVNLVKRICLMSFSLMITSPVFSESVKRYKGVAYNEKNEIVYIENHTVTYSDQTTVKKSKTTYLNTKGEKIAELNSEFGQSLSAPSYNFKDFRHKKGHGIAYVNNQIQMIQLKKDGTKKTKFIQFKPLKNQIIVGGQGLHYYLSENFKNIKNKKDIPLRFLTPGNLSYYNFLLNYVGEEKPDRVNLEIKISNFFLRVFASKIKMKYNSKTKEIIEYEGLSNLLDNKGKAQAVKIKYQHN